MYRACSKSVPSRALFDVAASVAAILSSIARASTPCFTDGRIGVQVDKIGKRSIVRTCLQKLITFV